MMYFVYNIEQIHRLVNKLEKYFFVFIIVTGVSINHAEESLLSHIGSLKDMALWLKIAHLSASREFFAQWFQ